MPHFCSVVICSMRTERDNVSFFRFPAVLTNRGDDLFALSNERRNAWIRALKRGPFTDSQLKHRRICSRHFISGKPAALEDKINPDWIPSQNLGYVSSVLPNPSAAHRFDRSAKRPTVETQVQNLAVDNEKISTEHFEDDISASNYHGSCISKASQNELTVEYLSQVFSELNFCNSQIYTLKTKLEIMDLNEDGFKNNDTKTCYFTGLVKADMLFLIHNQLSPHLLTPMQFFQLL